MPRPILRSILELVAVVQVALRHTSPLLAMLWINFGSTSSGLGS